MYQFDRMRAEATLGALSLTENERAFGAWWLDMMDIGATPLDFPPPGAIADALVTFEVHPDAVYWLSAGARIAREVGGHLVGLDYVEMAAPRERATRLERVTAVANGAISQQQRSVVSQRGRVHFIREIAVPFGLSGAGYPRTMTHVEADTEASLGGVDVTRGAMNLAPQYEVHPIV